MASTTLSRLITPVIALNKCWWWCGRQSRLAAVGGGAAVVVSVLGFLISGEGECQRHLSDGLGRAAAAGGGVGGSLKSSTLLRPTHYFQRRELSLLLHKTRLRGTSL